MAAFFVLVSHSFGLLGKGLQQPGLWYSDKHLVASDLGLYIFFTISGYLVTQSLINSDSLKQYAWKRFLRIMPALIVVNLACIVMGGFITSLPFSAYLFNTATWTYFLKNTTLIVNQFTLPGVFTHLRDDSVNASLWTLLVEVECYVLLALGAYAIVVRKWLFLLCFILFEALRIYLHLIHNTHIKGLDVEVDFTYGTYFFLGSLLYVFKEDIRLRWLYANVLMAIALLSVSSIFQPVTEAVFIAYCILIVGDSKSIVNLKGFDLSYGLYLYAFPVQQFILYMAGYEINVWIHILLTTIFTLVFAWLSWTFVEKPLLKMKSKVL